MGIIAKHLKNIAFIGILVGTSLPAPSGAQTARGDYYRETPKSVAIALVRRDDLPPGSFALRMTTERSVQGCPKLGPLEHQVKFYSQYMDIGVKDYTVDFRDLPQNPQYSCGTRSSAPSADIVLSRDMLKEAGTRKILMRIGTSVNYFDITHNDQMVRITPAPEQIGQPTVFKPLNVDYVQNTMQHYFYPEGTLVLAVSKAGPGMDVKGSLDALGYSRGLVPLEAMMPDFINPLRDGRGYYYVDKTGHIAGSVPPGQTVSVGNVTTEMKVYGLHGDEYKQRNLNVSAHKPSMFE